MSVVLVIADLIWYFGERGTHQNPLFFICFGIHVPFFIHCHAPISIVIYVLLLIISDSGRMKHSPLEGLVTYCVTDGHTWRFHCNY